MKLHHALAIGALLSAGNVQAGSGTTPSKIQMSAMTLIPGIDEVRVFEANGALVAVVQSNADGVGNPEGISLIRGGNHKIQRPGPGKQLQLIDTAADASGNVFITYNSPSNVSGLAPLTRRIKPDNTLGFEKSFNIEPMAAIAAAGDGGVYLASHVPYAPQGSSLMTLTHHRVYRLSPSGDVVWQKEATGQKVPTGASQYASTATSDNDSIFVGYGIGDGGQNLGLIPVIGHRLGSDGSELFTRVGLKKPSTALPGSPAQGMLGNDPINGLVEHIVIASDGTAIASAGKFVVHVDASGVQTEAFECTGAPDRFAAHEMACVKLTQKLAVTRFGVESGHLKMLSYWLIDAPAGTSQTAWAPLTGGRVLVAGLKDGKASLRMYSSSGALMTTWSSEVAGTITELGALNGEWLGYGAETPPSWLRSKGTYTIGGAKLPITNVSPTNVRPLPH
jgi:hypothetical protein